MDPDATLAELRATLDVLERAGALAEIPAAQDAADHFAALDEWLSKGGFLPLAWKAAGRAAD